MTDAVSIRGRFRRSVHLARDLHDPHGLDGYVVTTKGRELVGRLADAFAADSSARAWAVAGPYGGGKSALALFAAHLLRGHTPARDRLAEADAPLAERFRQSVEAVYHPVLVVGAREPLAEALARGLDAALERLPVEVEMPEETGDRSVFARYVAAARAVHRQTGGGLLLVVDELGKLLEHAALHPERGDLFLLQQLAEHAARGHREEDPAPLLVLTVLHQAFDRYAGRLSEAQREEWRKVQGRFEDFAHVEPVDETLRLLAHSVERGARALPPVAQEAVGAVEEAASLPAHFDAERVQEHLEAALPLHPAVALLVGPLFRKLAQSERSLFAFLASGEPHSFLDVMARPAAENAPLYRLDHLYDYLTGALGATLHYGGVDRLWAETEATLGRLDSPDELAVRLLKQIALLDFAGDLAGLPPSTAVLRATADAPPEVVDAALDALRQQRALTYRPFSTSYHVWQGSDFQLDEALRKARDTLPARVPLAEELRQTLPPVPIVARRHSYRTGTDRLFEVTYASDTSWRALLEEAPEEADGRIVYVLPEEPGTRQALLDALRQSEAGPLTLFAVPEGTDRLRATARDLAALDHVRRHAPALEGDAAARLEVDRQRADLAATLQTGLTELLADAAACVWVRSGETITLSGERALQEHLSALCDEVFHDAPEVWNELLNRRYPSSSAVRALKLLLQAMIEHPAEERLGIEGTPAEYGLYASLLQATGMHRIEDGIRTFAPPADDRPGCRAVWDAIEAAFATASGSRVSVQVIYDRLAAPPFGMREALVPVFLLAYVQHAGSEIAWYEAGTFVPEVGYYEIERLLKNPDKFEVQRVRLDGPRADTLAALAPLVGLPPAEAEPLAVVLRLLRAVRGLPPYTRRTARLPDEALAVREALHHAVEPVTLLLDELPRACGLPSLLDAEASDREAAGLGGQDAVPLTQGGQLASRRKASKQGVEGGAAVSTNTRAEDTVAIFIDRLRQSLRALGAVYGGLLEEIGAALAEAFGLPEEDAVARRDALAERARALLPHATDPMLKAFLVRATDQVLEPQAWLESLAALLAKRPPAQWVDEDRPTFTATLRETARRFRTLEPLVFGEMDTPGGDGAPGQRLRLGVTALGGTEREAVVHLAPADEPAARAAASRLRAALDAESVSLDARLAALGRLLDELLAERAATLDAPPDA